MAEAKTFSHIKVSNEDEDDVVIHVGAHKSVAYAEAQPGPKDRCVEATVAQKDTKAPCARDEAKPEKVAKPQDRCVPEQKIEDLSSIPMPLKQKIVLILAILLIIGFSIYYFFLR